MKARLAIVTPAKNEALNLPHLFESLLLQSSIEVIQNWVIVDDGSQDDTFKIASSFAAPFPINVLRNHSSGRLIKGGAYESWFKGLTALKLEDFSHFMKLDADVVLDKSFFREVFDFNQNAIILGGVLNGFAKEQNIHIPGPAKIYRSDFFENLNTLPRAPGFDIMDEVLAYKLGEKVQVVKSAKIELRRSIGGSEGRLHGRFRNGCVCRWTGYNQSYFILHLTRYFFRSPYFLGAIWMLVGYLNAGISPFPEELRRLHSNLQKKKLIMFLKHPIRWIRNVYYS